MMTCGESVDFTTCRRCAKGARSNRLTARPRTAGDPAGEREPVRQPPGWSWSTTADHRGLPVRRRHRWSPPCGSPTTRGPGHHGAGPARCRAGPGDARRAHQASRPAGPRWTPARCARCGSRRATAWPSSRAGSCSRSIPGWSDMARGMPGYSRDVIGQTPFGWSLDDAMEGLGPRADRATAFWRWRASEDAWAWVPAGRARPSAGPARPRRPVLGRQRGQAADGRRVRAAAHPEPPVHGAVHDRHELPADAGGRAVRGGRRRPPRGSSWPWPPPCRARRRPGSSCGWRSTRGGR